MDLVFEPSRGGSPTCRAGFLHLHSPYSPEREAERFLERRLPSSPPLVFVLLGPCLDYLSRQLRERYPRSAIISIQYSSSFRGLELGRADATWYPDQGDSLSSFLDAVLDEDSVSGFLALDWTPAARAYPEMARICAAELRASLERLASSAATVKAFGRRWFSNACRSFLLVERLAIPRRTSLPAVVAAAGPSLDEALSDIAGYRDSFVLVSVSSALSACLARGLAPDLVVTTDGGSWSRLHLYPQANLPIPVAAPLTALPSASLASETPLLPIDQGAFVESELTSELGRGLRVPPHGTVAGSAIRIASILCSGPILVAGLDLAVRGDREHVRPHGFDAFIDTSSVRLAPVEGKRFSRSLEGAPLALADGWRGSRSLSAYASVIGDEAGSFAGRLRRIHPSPIALEGLSDISSRELGAFFSVAGPAEPRLPGRLIEDLVPAAPAAARARALERRISAWRSLSSEAASALGRGVPPKETRVRELFRAIDLPDWAAAVRALAGGSDPGPSARALAESVDEFLSDIRRRLLA